MTAGSELNEGLGWQWEYALKFNRKYNLARFPNWMHWVTAINRDLIVEFKICAAKNYFICMDANKIRFVSAMNGAVKWIYHRGVRR